MTLCNRFVGYGIDVGVPEQAAALEALGLIGGPEGSRTVVQLIVKESFKVRLWSWQPQ